MDELQVMSLENELKDIDESRLPEVIARRIDDVAGINEKYQDALTKKKKAQEKIDKAFSDADTLVKKAAKLGELTPKTHKFFNHEWSNTKDRIVALEECVKEIGTYGTDTAELQRTIIKIQDATLESQTAVMNVQTKQMQYIEHTNEALKFLYGLNAYGIASTESIVTNLQLVLSGAKKKQLGEMAKQQMYLVMDQLKSHENITKRLGNNEEKIEYIEDALRVHSEKEDEQRKRIDAVEAKDREQDIILEKQLQKDKEHDKALAAAEKRDVEQDRLLKAQAEKDLEHDKAIEAGIQRDVEQDRLLKAQAEKDLEHDKAIEAGIQRDVEQDRLLKAQIEKDLEHDKAIEAGIQRDVEQDRLLKAQAEKDLEYDKAIEAGIQRDVEQDRLLKAQFEKDLEHDKQINELAAKYASLIQEISILKEENNNLKKQSAILLKNSKRNIWKLKR